MKKRCEVYDAYYWQSSGKWVEAFSQGKPAKHPDNCESCSKARAQ